MHISLHNISHSKYFKKVFLNCCKSFQKSSKNASKRHSLILSKPAISDHGSEQGRHIAQDDEGVIDGSGG